MSAIATWNVPASKMLLLQQLVKRYNLRFNPLKPFDAEHLRIDVEFGHVSPETMSAFYADWERFNTPIVEKTSSAWRRTLRRIKGRIINFISA